MPNLALAPIWHHAPPSLPAQWIFGAVHKAEVTMQSFVEMCHSLSVTPVHMASLVPKGLLMLAALRQSNA